MISFTLIIDCVRLYRSVYSLRACRLDCEEKREKREAKSISPKLRSLNVRFTVRLFGAEIPLSE
jgi:hypothetical protein